MRGPHSRTRPPSLVLCVLLLAPLGHSVVQGRPIGRPGFSVVEDSSDDVILEPDTFLSGSGAGGVLGRGLLQQALDSSWQPSGRRRDLKETDYVGADIVGSDPVGADTVGSDPYGSDTRGSDPYGGAGGYGEAGSYGGYGGYGGYGEAGASEGSASTSSTDYVGSDPVGSDTVGSDPVGSDTVGTQRRLRWWGLGAARQAPVDDEAAAMAAALRLAEEEITAAGRNAALAPSDVPATVQQAPRDTGAAPEPVPKVFATGGARSGGGRAAAAGASQRQQRVVTGTFSIALSTAGDGAVSAGAAEDPVARLEQLLHISRRRNLLQADLQGLDPVGSDIVGSDPVGADTVGSDPYGSDTRGSDPYGGAGGYGEAGSYGGYGGYGVYGEAGASEGSASTSGTDYVGSDPVGSDTVGSDPVGSDTVGLDPVGSST